LLFSTKPARSADWDFSLHPAMFIPSRRLCEKFDNHLPKCQRAGELPTDSMAQPRRYLAPRPRNCSDSHRSPVAQPGPAPGSRPPQRPHGRPARGPLTARNLRLPNGNWQRLRRKRGLVRIIQESRN
jgi:hypothetical protein